MISLITKNNKFDELKNSLTVTYPRTVNIIFGNYPYPDIIHNLILQIKNNLDPKMENYTKVKGGMTDWKYFLNNKEFNNFITYIINKHQNTHSEIFKYFFEKNCIVNAWGNEIKKEDSIDYHSHIFTTGILYLTKGCDLELPELNIKITPQPGDYYIFPSEIMHGFQKTEEKNNRYSIAFDIGPSLRRFEFEKKNK